MRPENIQQIGDEIAIKWDDGMESFIKLDLLRRACPCAGCKGEMDIFGNLYKDPPKPLNENSVQLMKLGYVGGYALQPQWADGHNSGLFSYEYLRKISEALEEEDANTND